MNHDPNGGRDGGGEYHNNVSGSNHSPMDTSYTSQSPLNLQVPGGRIDIHMVKLWLLACVISTISVKIESMVRVCEN